MRLVFRRLSRHRENRKKNTGRTADSEGNKGPMPKCFSIPSMSIPPFRIVPYSTVACPRMQAFFPGFGKKGPGQHIDSTSRSFWSIASALRTDSALRQRPAATRFWVTLSSACASWSTSSFVLLGPKDTRSIPSRTGLERFIAAYTWLALPR